MNSKTKPNTSELLSLDMYDKIVVAFSGGKDSEACILHLLEMGVRREDIVLWHHHIDGAPGQEQGLMDWSVTEDYCRAVARELGIEIRFSWKEGGFEGEMLRENALTAPTSFEMHDGGIKTVGGTRGKLSTRRMFPQVTANLSVRWCSAYLKIDVCSAVFANDPAYKNGTFLLITGERREESASRATYAEVEKHRRSNKSRRVDHWRAVIDWDEAKVWGIIERWKIQVHPAYRLGWGRVSWLLRAELRVPKDKNNLVDIVID